MYRPIMQNSAGFQLIASKKSGLERKKKNAGRNHRRCKKRKYNLLTYGNVPSVLRRVINTRKCFITAVVVSRLNEGVLAAVQFTVFCVFFTSRCTR
jgi:hypothetical protein